MGMYDFNVGVDATEPSPVDVTPPAGDAAAGGPPWATLEDSPPITCRDCFSVYFAWQWIPTADGWAGVWSKTDAWCRASGVQVQGGVDTPRRCLDSDPDPAPDNGRDGA